MTTFIARLGQLETRRTTRTIWLSGKRKRAGGEWMCAECTRQSKDVRLYSPDTSLPWKRKREPVSWKARGEHEKQGSWGLNSFSIDPIERTAESKKTKTHGSRHNAESRTPGIDEAWMTTDGEQRTTDGLGGHEAQWEQLESEDPFESASDDAQAPKFDSPPATRSARFQWGHVEGFDYKTAFVQALSNNEPDLVARCLFTAERLGDTQFIDDMSQPTFTMVLELLQPANSVSKLASAHIELSAATVSYMNITPIKTVAFEYASMLEQAFLIRRSRGHKLSLADYKALLRSARDLGDRRMGKMIWTFLHEDGHLPDTACYNHYMASVVFNGAHDATLRRRRRIIPFDLSLRQSEASSVHDYRVGPEGVRKQALGIFEHMLQNGVIADEQSFLIVITAAAREGDMNTVKSFLKKVWGLDVDAILSETKGLDMQPHKLSPKSPLHPTGDLLFTIAHVFGSNNNIPAALRLIDVVARHYAIEVPDQSWRQLMEWTFVLAARRHGTTRRNGSTAGALPTQGMTHLWNTMTDAPYFVKPSMGMYNFMIKNLFDRRHSLAMIEKMKEGYEIYLDHRGLANKSRHALATAISRRDRGLPLRDSIENLRKDWEYNDLIRRRDVFWLKRWLRLLLGSAVNRSRIDQNFAVEDIPALLWEWRAMAPTRVEYHTPTGIVELEIRQEEDMEQNRNHINRARLESEMLREAAPRFIGHDWLRGTASRRSPNYQISDSYGIPSEKKSGSRRPIAPEEP